MKFGESLDAVRKNLESASNNLSKVDQRTRVLTRSMREVGTLSEQNSGQDSGQDSALISRQFNNESEA